jgi:hypothetical protein
VAPWQQLQHMGLLLGATVAGHSSCGAGVGPAAACKRVLRQVARPQGLRSLRGSSPASSCAIACGLLCRFCPLPGPPARRESAAISQLRPGVGHAGPSAHQRRASARRRPAARTHAHGRGLLHQHWGAVEGSVLGQLAPPPGEHR